MDEKFVALRMKLRIGWKNIQKCCFAIGAARLLNDELVISCREIVQRYSCHNKRDDVVTWIVYDMNFCNASTGRIGRSSLSEILCLPTVREWDSAPATWCLRPARWTTSNSNSGSSKRLHESLSILFLSLRIIFKESWCVQIVSRVPFRYGRNGKAAQIMAKHSRRIVLHLRMASVNDLETCLMSLFLLSSCVWRNTHLTWKSHASVFRIVSLIEFGRARTGGGMSKSFSEFMDFNTVSLIGPNGFGWSICSFSFKSPTMQTKLETNLQTILYSLREEQSSMKLGGGRKSLMVFVVWDTTSRGRGWIACPKQSIFLTWNRNSFSLSATPALQRCSRCFCDNLEKVIASTKYTRINCHLTVKIMTSIARWNVPGSSRILNCILMSWYSAWYEVKAVLIQSTSWSSTWQYPLFAARLEKIASS